MLLTCETLFHLNIVMCRLYRHPHPIDLDIKTWSYYLLYETVHLQSEYVFVESKERRDIHVLFEHRLYHSGSHKVSIALWNGLFRRIRNRDIYMLISPLLWVVLFIVLLRCCSFQQLYFNRSKLSLVFYVPVLQQVQAFPYTLFHLVFQ